MIGILPGYGLGYGQTSLRQLSHSLVTKAKSSKISMT